VRHCSKGEQEYDGCRHCLNFAHKFFGNVHFIPSFSYGSSPKGHADWPQKGLKKFRAYFSNQKIQLTPR
jgi:hypothetical protein